MSNLNSAYDNNDFDNFLNLDNDFNTSLSPAIPTLAHQSSAASSAIIPSAQPVFQGPSYQYDSHRQQTGLPMGGLANTFAVNQASGLHYRPGNLGFVMPTETLNLPLSTLDEFDFGQSQYEMNDVDFDADSPSDVQSMFYTGGPSQIKSESSQSTPIQRIYPGMHSQQAAQAKQRQDMLRQQQSQPKQIPGQLPFPSQAPKAAKDPHVEESISRLLNRMRQSSASSVDDPTSPGAMGGMSNISKPKKDEEDMDEDERLLASEEGKKLSSKERRQLRNKVSARAFRSRRKEYIGQLEAELAAKVQEANDLRVQNRQVMEENTRLTDLTRMLLSSQAFSGFLQELSKSGMTLPSNTTVQQVSQQPQRQARKDVAAHEASREIQSQNNHQIGMTLIPETTVDMSDFSGNWNAPVPSNDFQVFAITALPELPALDLETLSEKRTSKTSAIRSMNKEALELSSLPSAFDSAVTTKTITTTVDEDANDLYAPQTSPTNAQQPVEALLASIKTSTSSESPNNTTANSIAEDSSEFERMCAELDDLCDRVADYLP